MRLTRCEQFLKAKSPIDFRLEGRLTFSSRKLLAKAPAPMVETLLPSTAAGTLTELDEPVYELSERLPSCRVAK
jgi:hypothetical protein